MSGKGERFEIVLDGGVRLRLLARLLRRLEGAGVVVVAVRIEVVSPDSRVYGFQPWYPIEVRKQS